MLDSVRYLKVAYFHRGMAATTKAEETWWDEKFLILDKLPTELLDSDPEELLQVTVSHC
ncbi:MAG: hypothetical protein Q4A82_05740 [Corynebacterium sp.]|nr:hypothetical protein [Corynebacterium sp.]